MGDRANVAIIQHPYLPYAKTTDDTIPRAIWVYLHWGGYNLPSTLRDAIEAARPRWDDESYGTHILIDQLTKGERDEETGCGISLTIGDNEYDVLVVDLDAQVVRVVPQGPASAGALAESDRTFTFTEYLALDFTDEWDVLKRT
jgi:hypothetical protein